MRVFVTGGSGFIGSAVVRDLVRAGHDVLCLLRPTSDTRRIDALGIKRLVGDVSDLASVRAGVRRCDATIHLAAPGGWGADDPLVLRRVIDGGSRNVLQAARAVPRHRVVYVSSTAAVNCSRHPQVFDERSAFTIRDEAMQYALAKHRAELLAREAHECGTPTVIVNPSEVYGPDDHDLRSAGNLVDFATSWPVLVTNGGTNVVHVDDVSAGIVAALAHGVSGERYILGGENVTIREIAELVRSLTGRSAPIVTVPRVVARLAARAAITMHVPLPGNAHVVPYATRYWYVSSRKAQAELGVTFRGARETLEPTLEWLMHAGLLSSPPA